MDVEEKIFLKKNKKGQIFYDRDLLRKWVREIIEFI